MEPVIPLALLSSDLKLNQAVIKRLDAEGAIEVGLADEDRTLSCQFLRTSGGPLPKLTIGDKVLVIRIPDDERAFILGVIESYGADQSSSPSPSDLDLEGSRAYFEESCRQIKFNADERIELHCGASHLIMDKDGKIVLRAERITTRARGANKVKGGTVQIN